MALRPPCRRRAPRRCAGRCETSSSCWCSGDGPATTWLSTSLRTPTSRPPSPARSIDFDQGTMITHNVVEAMRRTGVPLIMYASGSGVYGDLGEEEAVRISISFRPQSQRTVASKLAGEALISAYAHMFETQRSACFALGTSSVGARRTGWGWIFLRASSLEDSDEADRASGDGSQSKSYVLATDVVQCCTCRDRCRYRAEAFMTYSTSRLAIT